MRLVLLLLFCALLTSAAPANDLPLATSEQREQLRHEKFLQEHPNSTAAHTSYADFLSDHNNLRAAIAHWRTAQQLDPDDAANALGGAYLRMGNAASSAAEFARAIGLDRNNVAYHSGSRLTTWNMPAPMPRLSTAFLTRIGMKPRRPGNTS